MVLVNEVNNVVSGQSFGSGRYFIYDSKVNQDTRGRQVTEVDQDTQVRQVTEVG